MNEVGFGNFHFSRVEYPEVAEPLRPGTYYLWQPRLEQEIVYFLAPEAWRRGKAAHPEHFFVYVVREDGWEKLDEEPQPCVS